MVEENVVIKDVKAGKHEKAKKAQSWEDENITWKSKIPFIAMTKWNF